MLMPCGPKQPGAVQTTMQELAAEGLASKVRVKNLYLKSQPCLMCHAYWSYLLATVVMHLWLMTY